MQRMAILATVLVLALGGLLLAGCSLTDDAQAQRLRAEAELERQRSEDRIRESETAHRQAMELIPVLLIIVAGMVVTSLAAGVIVWLMRKPPAAAIYQPPTLPPTVNIFVLPPPAGNGHADYWRQIETATRRQVTIYNKTPTE